jgi:hypothetical protein
MISNETAEAYVKQIEEMLTQISDNADPYAQGERLFRCFQWFKKREKFLEAMLEGLRSREALTSLVVSLPAEVGTQLPEIAALFKFAPPIFWRTIMDVIHAVAKANPVEGGRPELMKDIEAKLKICKEILQLDWEGVSRMQSYKRIAQRHGVSVRKVERIWRERLTLQSAEPRTLSDFFNAFNALSKLGK